MLSGLMTAAAFAAFIGVVVWAYSRDRHNDFRQAARLPLDDDCGEHQ
ncbi:cytochrome c oxidase subunit CcoQ [Oceanococcus atlanticus]|uniref:Cytochrome c oxidase subunit CcoQ n=1 Tax=Oceanococcus atlanticus TaxID=1317117 RepID=A0A1Y1SDQ3_9GAMM|nr:cytochrome c oxidase subunit CcoQ [Oceanococcus atlanticus]RZO86897.1 MAG: CcoQ/FixQ family Cbb3-type cytochrome c oxidase assembly chaperone [Oceanococcus sp.]